MSMNELIKLFAVFDAIDVRAPNFQEKLYAALVEFSCEDLLCMELAIGNMEIAYSMNGVFDVIHDFYSEYELSDDGVAYVFGFFIYLGAEALSRIAANPKAVIEYLADEELEEIQDIGETVVCCCAGAMMQKGCSGFDHSAPWWL